MMLWKGARRGCRLHLIVHISLQFGSIWKERAFESGVGLGFKTYTLTTQATSSGQVDVESGQAEEQKQEQLCQTLQSLKSFDNVLHGRVALLKEETFG